MAELPLPSLTDAQRGSGAIAAPGTGRRAFFTLLLRQHFSGRRTDVTKRAASVMIQKRTPISVKHAARKLPKAPPRRASAGGGGEARKRIVQLSGA